MVVVVVIIYPVPCIHGSLGAGAGVGVGERGPRVCLRAPPPRLGGIGSVPRPRNAADWSADLIP